SRGINSRGRPSTTTRNCTPEGRSSSVATPAKVWPSDGFRLEPSATLTALAICKEPRTFKPVATFSSPNAVGAGSALLTVVSRDFRVDPLANISRTVLQLNVVHFTARQEWNGTAIDQRHVFKVERDLLARCLRIQEPFEFFNMLHLNSAAQRED